MKKIKFSYFILLFALYFCISINNVSAAEITEFFSTDLTATSSDDLSILKFSYDFNNRNCSHFYLAKETDSKNYFFSCYNGEAIKIALNYSSSHRYGADYYKTYSHSLDVSSKKSNIVLQFNSNDVLSKLYFVTDNESRLANFKFDSVDILYSTLDVYDQAATNQQLLFEKNISADELNALLPEKENNSNNYFTVNDFPLSREELLAIVVLFSGFSGFIILNLWYRR